MGAGQRYPDFEDPGELGPGEGRPTYTASWYDVLGRTEVAANYGDNGGSMGSRPGERPGSSAESVRTTRHLEGAALSDARFRWQYSQGEDGSIAGQEIDALGNVVLSWTASSESDDSRVRTVA